MTRCRPKCDAVQTYRLWRGADLSVTRCRPVCFSQWQNSWSSSWLLSSVDLGDVHWLHMAVPWTGWWLRLKDKTFTWDLSTYPPTTPPPPPPHTHTHKERRKEQCMARHNQNQGVLWVEIWAEVLYTCLYSKKEIVLRFYHLLTLAACSFNLVCRSLFWGQIQFLSEELK